MKVILSRKGFDSSNGGIPSPILPDGTLLSMPIPAKHDALTFDNLQYHGVAYADILKQLRGKDCKENHFHCHLDPDIRECTRITEVKNWIPAFGQIGSAQGILRNQQITVGDLFLFFGWFRQTEGDLTSGTLQFKKGAPDLNVIYGYLQIGNRIHQKEELKNKYHWHPHAADFRAGKSNNILYLPTKQLDFNDQYKGAGVFSFAENRVLTMPGKTRSVWKEINALLPENICGNHKNSAKTGGVCYGGIWQEKVLKENSLSEEWAKELFN